MLLSSWQDLQVLDGRFLVWGPICHSSSIAELLLGPAGPGCQISSVRNNLPQLSTAELLPGPEGSGWQICAVGNNLPQLSAAELLPGPADPGWQICATVNDVPQFQHC